MSDVHPSEAEGRTPTILLGCPYCDFVCHDFPTLTAHVQPACAQNIPMPSAERCREFNLPASIGATTIPASMLVRNTSDRVEIPAAPSVEARDSTLLGYPLRVDSSIPADEIRFVQNGQIVGVIRLAPASLLPPENP
jgi:hypothetical protein